MEDERRRSVERVDQVTIYLYSIDPNETVPLYRNKELDNDALKLVKSIIDSASPDSHIYLEDVSFETRIESSGCSISFSVCKTPSEFKKCDYKQMCIFRDSTNWLVHHIDIGSFSFQNEMDAEDYLDYLNNHYMVEPDEEYVDSHFRYWEKRNAVQYNECKESRELNGLPLILPRPVSNLN